jgi:hypothetical protein
MVLHYLLKKKAADVTSSFSGLAQAQIRHLSLKIEGSDHE